VGIAVSLMFCDDGPETVPWRTDGKPFHWLVGELQRLYEQGAKAPTGLGLSREDVRRLTWVDYSAWGEEVVFPRNCQDPMDLERALIKLLSVLPRISRLGGRPDLLDVLAHAVEDAVLVCKSADDLGTLVYWLGA
jgi:hypothetical protein